jgi:[ribosomal protein S18]-alanine N-acetyltransferase
MRSSRTKTSRRKAATAPTGPAGREGRDGREDRDEVVIAPMRSRDVKAVLVIERAVFPEPWSHRLFTEELAQRNTRAYRALWIGRHLIGYGGLMFVDDEAHVNSIAIDPGHQNAGLGTALFFDLVETALGRGSRHLTLEVRVGNEPAITLYRRFGLAPVGVRSGYYAGGDDALIMWARDIDSDTYRTRLDDIRGGRRPGLEVHSRW